MTNDRCAKAVTRIQNKKYDTEAWNMLVKEASSKNVSDVEAFYEELINIFPTCGRFWRSYIEHQMRAKNFDKVTKLFQRSLEELLNVDLYKCYLNYVRETKINEPDLVYKAYRFTLDKVGMDPNAIGIYNDYIQFLKDREVDGSYLDSQKITAVRKAYQEGIYNPMFHIELLWKEYVTYEQSINPIIADKMVQERSRDHMNARRVAKEWEVTIRGLNRSWAAAPPTFTIEELRQVEIWRRYIDWEKKNPLRTENNIAIIRRVIYAYKQCILCFGHHPNFWHEFATYLDEQIRSLGEKEVEFSRRLSRELTNLFDRATKGLMQHNLLIHFSYADFEEHRGNKKKAIDIYNNLIELSKTIEDIDITLVYIQYIRFTRRTDSLKSARAIFKRARDDDRCGHHIYIASALMEYHCNKDHTVACKIFELGLKKFNDNPDFILSYINFMNSLNEENNTRVLFERVITTCPLKPKDTIEIWNSFLNFEAGLGDLSSVCKIERRRAIILESIYPNCSSALWAVDKYKFQDLNPCSPKELRSMRFEQPWDQCADVQEQPNQMSIEAPMAFKTNSMCYPDLKHMLPFKPIVGPIPGGVFPPPPAVAHLLSRLPQSFWGPFVDIDALCTMIRCKDFDQLYDQLLEHKRDIIKPRPKKVRVE